MALKVANRGDVPVFLALQTLRQATALEKTGKEILHLEIGQPFDGAPKAAPRLGSLAPCAEGLAQLPVHVGAPPLAVNVPALHGAALLAPAGHKEPKIPASAAKRNLPRPQPHLLRSRRWSSPRHRRPPGCRSRYCLPAPAGHVLSSSYPCLLS